ncbi:ABC transporter ATP-binding protein [Egicoccus sp. AB-alg2]|uniref:ABC transporter ATP-binding protein n=1 Tax=Egicoccus sp. AB-alg2 TaxID=3242693 RepID=UPI00359E5371
MADTEVSAPPPVTAQEEEGHLTVLTRDLHVTYRVYEDRRPRMKDFLAGGLKRPSYREIHAVRGVDLEARSGEAIGVLGHNGSGKSTLMQAIAGLLPASKGEVYASSQPNLLGVSAALSKNSSGRRNIVLGGLALGLSREEIAARVDDTIEFTGLDDFIDLPIRTYSSGMRARLHFAIATMVEPEILLVDEALSVGDEEFKERSKKRIDRLRDQAGTVFIVSHSLGSIRDLCTRAIWLHKGLVREDGTPVEVVKSYKKYLKAIKEGGKSEGPGAAS